MKFWEIARKDLKLLWRDKRTAFILVALPMIFITVIGLTFGQLLGWKNANQLYKIAVYDGVDYGEFNPRGWTGETRPEHYLAKTPMNEDWAYNIVTELFEQIDRREGIVVQYVDSEQQARALANDGKVSGALIVDPDFIEKLMAIDPEEAFAVSEEGKSEEKRLEDLDLHLHAEHPDSAVRTILEVLVGKAVEETIRPYVLCSLDPADFGAEGLANAGGITGRLNNRCGPVRAKAEDPTVERVSQEEVEQASKRDIYRVLVPGYTVLFVFFLVNIMGHSFIHERDLGTLRRLRIAPISGPALLMGKTIPFFFISLVQTAILFGFGKWPLGMSVGEEPWLLVPIAVSTSLAATCLGLLIATLVRTESQVATFANFVVILAGAISGCFMPREWLPEPMQKISLATPHAWALEAYGEALRKATPNVEAVFQSCGVLLAFAALYFALGAWQFRRIE